MMKTKRTRTAVVALLCSAFVLGSCSENKEQTTTTTAQVQVMKETIEDTEAATEAPESEPEASAEETTSAASDKKEDETTKPIEPELIVEASKEEIIGTKACVEEAVKKGVEASMKIYDADKDGNELINELYDAFDLETLYYITTGEVRDKETILESLTNGGEIDFSSISQIAANSQSEDYSWEISYSAPVTDDNYKDMYNMLNGVNEDDNEMIAEMYKNIPSFEKAKEDLGIEDVWCCTIESRNKPTEENLALFENADTAELMDKIKEIYGIELTDDGYVLATMNYFVIKRNGEWKLDMGYTSLYQAIKLFQSGFMDELISSLQEGLQSADFTEGTTSDEAA